MYITVIYIHVYLVVSDFRILNKKTIYKCCLLMYWSFMFLEVLGNIFLNAGTIYYYLVLSFEIMLCMLLMLRILCKF